MNNLQSIINISIYGYGFKILFRRDKYHSEQTKKYKFVKSFYSETDWQVTVRVRHTFILRILLNRG